MSRVNDSYYPPIRPQSNRGRSSKRKDHEFQTKSIPLPTETSFQTKDDYEHTDQNLSLLINQSKRESIEEQSYTNEPASSRTRASPLKKPNKKLIQALKETSYLSSDNDEPKFVIRELDNYEPKSADIKEEIMKKPKNWKILSFPHATFYGEIINNRRHGKGILKRNDKSVYEGEWANDLKHGFGLETTRSGSVYEGIYSNGQPDGPGIFRWVNGEVYEGDWKNGRKHGQGTWKGTNGETYMGEWKHDKQDGHGVFIWSNGERYEGEFQNFLKHGKGEEHFMNGDYYKRSVL